MQLLQGLPLLAQLLLALEVLLLDFGALSLLEPENRALLVIDTMQFFIFLFEVEDLIDNTADVAILLALLRPRLHCYRLSNNRVLQAAGPHMSEHTIFLFTYLLLGNRDDFLSSELPLLVHAQSCRVDIPVLLLLTLLLRFFY